MRHPSTPHFTHAWLLSANKYTKAATLSHAAAASPYCRGRKDYREPLITVVKMQGILQSFSGPARAPQGRRLLNVDRVQRWLERAFHKPLAPAAMALVVNSPGGSPAQAEMIHNLVKRLSKESGIKVLTFAEEVAASGGWGEHAGLHCLGTLQRLATLMERGGALSRWVLADVRR